MAKEYSIDDMIGENVFAIIGYVQRALRHSGFSKRVIDEYHKKVTSGDYYDACAISQDYIDMVNDKVAEQEKAVLKEAFLKIKNDIVEDKDDESTNM